MWAEVVMLRSVLVASGLLLGLATASLRPFTPQLVLAQQGSPQEAAPGVNARLDQAFHDIRELRTLVAAQASRITNLERSVRSLQDQSQTPVGYRWKTAEGWAGIRIGMSRAEVEYILGPPKTVDSVIDRQTLTYGTASTVVGMVTLVDDRVSQVEAPGFKILVPELNK